MQRRPEPPGPSIFKSPAPPTFERAFVGKDDDGVYVPLAILGGELAQLATKVFEDRSLSPTLSPPSSAARKPSVLPTRERCKPSANSSIWSIPARLASV